MNFTGKSSLNLPHYVFKSLGKTAEKVHSKGEKHFPSLFHFVLIKLLALNELEKRKSSWGAFLSVLGLLARPDNSKSQEGVPSVGTNEETLAAE